MPSVVTTGVLALLALKGAVSQQIEKPFPQQLADGSPASMYGNSSMQQCAQPQPAKKSLFQQVIDDIEEGAEEAADVALAVPEVVVGAATNVVVDALLPMGITYSVPEQIKRDREMGRVVFTEAAKAIVTKVEEEIEPESDNDKDEL